MLPYRRGEGSRPVIYPELAITGVPPQICCVHGFAEQIERIIKEELAPLTATGPAMLLGAPFRLEGELYTPPSSWRTVISGPSTEKACCPITMFLTSSATCRSPERKIVPVKGLAAAVTVCEDMWNDRDLHPRPLYDLDPLEDLAARGEFNYIINLSASPYNFGKQALREKVAGYLAQKYGAGFLYVNQVGGNDELIFDGASLVFNHRGELLYRAAAFEEELFLLKVKPCCNRRRRRCRQ